MKATFKAQHFSKWMSGIAFTMLLMLFALFTVSEASAAEKIRTLDAQTTYQIDLDEDGTKETISFQLKAKKNDYYSYQLTINGKTATLRNKIYDAYDPHIQVADLDTSDGCIDLWVYTMGASEDIVYSSLWQYKEGILTCLYSFDDETEQSDILEFCCGTLYKTNGKGDFSIKADRAFFVDVLIGNHYDLIPMQLKDGKAAPVKTNTFKIVKIYNQKNQITLASKQDFSKTPGSTKTGFTAKRGDKVKPVCILCDGDLRYVKFKNKSGKTGWLCANDYTTGPFTDLVLVD